LRKKITGEISPWMDCVKWVEEVWLSLERLKGRVTNVIYSNMLGRYSLPFLDNIYGNGNFFSWFWDHEIKFLDWSSRSSDLNLVENVWKMLLDIVYDWKQFTSKNDLWLAIQKAGQSIMNNKRLIIQNMFNKYNSRLLQVIDVKGQTIKY